MKLPGQLSAFSFVRWLAVHLENRILQKVMGSAAVENRFSCTLQQHTHECMYNLCIFCGHGWNIKVQSPKSGEDLTSSQCCLQWDHYRACVCVYASSLSQQHHTACISFSPRGCVTVLLDWRLCASSFTKYSGYYGRWLIFKPQRFSCPVHTHTKEICYNMYHVMCVYMPPYS